MSESEEVDQLATSLKSSGVAASWIDAINKAKAILGFSNRKEEPAKVKIIEPSEEQKAKVDAIIKEVDTEIGTKETIEPKIIVQPEEPKILTNDVSSFDDPNFNIAESGMKVSDVVKAEEIFTNDPATLDKEKEGDKVEHPDDSIVMTNDEIKEETDIPKEEASEDDESDEEDEDTTYSEEKDITKDKTLFEFG
jgi:hypothetical protein